jgi:hypothetical protein
MIRRLPARRKYLAAPCTLLLLPPLRLLLLLPSLPLPLLELPPFPSSKGVEESTGPEAKVTLFLSIVCPCSLSLSLSLSLSFAGLSKQHTSPSLAHRSQYKHLTDLTCKLKTHHRLHDGAHRFFILNTQIATQLCASTKKEGQRPEERARAPRALERLEQARNDDAGIGELLRFLSVNAHHSDDECSSDSHS